MPDSGWLSAGWWSTLWQRRIFHNPAIKAVFDEYLTFKPKSIVVADTDEAVQPKLFFLFAENKDEEGFFFYEPKSREAVSLHLRELGMEHIPDLEDFLYYCTFASEYRRIGCAGCIMHLSQDFLFSEDEGPHFWDIENIKDWADSPVLYYASDGSLLLVNRSGHFGWYMMGENKIKRIATSVNAFAAQFLKALQSRSPMDAYLFP